MNNTTTKRRTWTHDLRDEDTRKGREIEELRQGMRDLTAYLTSSKFHTDPTVQARDVLTRLGEIASTTGE